MVRPILVTSYARPDLDGFGGAVTYAELLNQQGRPAVARFFAEPRGEERYVMEFFATNYPPTIPNDTEFQQVILVDASDRHGLEDVLDPLKVIEIIDHRAVHEAHEFPNAELQIEPVGAAATLVAERWYEFCHREPNQISPDPSFPKRGTPPFEPKAPLRGKGRLGGILKPTPLSAALLYGGIVSNTLNFQANVTTDRDRAMANWLQSFGELPADFVVTLFRRKSELSTHELHERFVGETGTRSFPNGSTSTYTQLELIDVPGFLARHEGELLTELAAIVPARRADYGWISLLDLTAGTTTFLATDDRATRLLTAVLGLTFANHHATYPHLILRKELHPKLKTHFDAS